MELKTFFAQDLTGNVIPNPTVHVYEAGTTTPVSGLQDADGAPLSNPFTGSSTGQITLAVPDGNYDLAITSGGRSMTMRVRFVSVTSDGVALAQAAAVASAGSAAESAAARVAAEAAAAAVLTGQGAGTLGFDTLENLNADLAHPARTVAYVTNDPNAANNGIYRKIGESGAGSWAKSISDPVTQVKSIGALMRNEGAIYPLKQIARNGTTSVSRSDVLSGILDIKVHGARPGKLYRLGWYGNGTTAFGSPNYQMLFSEYEAATYATAAVETAAISLNDIASNNIESGDVITRTFISTRIEGLAFVVTYRPAAMAATLGTSIDMQSNATKACWSWIIDPACYSYAPAKAVTVSQLPLIPASLLPDVLGVNAGKDAPFKKYNRNGVSYPALASAWRDGILDIKVCNARPGKYYRLEWYGNGTTAFGSPNYQMLFSEYEAATYATAAVETAAISLNDIASTNIESGDVITRTFISTRIEGLAFVVTYRPAAFTGTSSYVLNNANAGGGAGFGHIIDPANYFYASVLSVPESRVLPMAYSLDGDVLNVVFRHTPTNDIRLEFKPYGVNGILNFGNVYSAFHNGAAPSLIRTWTLMNTGGSDWLGPWRVRAVSNTDAGGIAFTGGTHGSNGDATGSPTGRTVSYSFAIDGTEITGPVAGGTAQKIVVTWTNRVQAQNTRTLAREVLEETFTATITPGAVEIISSITPLEDVLVDVYYGLQAQINGFRDSLHFLNGQQQGRFAIAGSTNYESGAHGSYPNVDRICHRGGTGDFIMWMDNTFGLGNARQLDATASKAIYQSYGKSYHVLIFKATGHPLAAGERLQWRGGYAWDTNRSADSVVDVAYRYADGGEIKYCAVFNAAGKAKVKPRLADQNLKINYLQGTGDAVTSAATEVSASGYGFTEFSIE